ncbi:hypothetical protein LTR85_009335 [Meristemomyces frigidus]|nr:hypothetical protein LTR85_009335 [Meristemomyces frigidus]
MESSARPKQPCYLLKLPAKLRLEKYSYLYDGPFTLQFNILDEVYVPFMESDLWRKSDDHGDGGKPDQGALALLRTCKLIHAEAAPIFADNLALALSVWSGQEEFIETYEICLGSVAGWPDLFRTKEIEIEVWDNAGSSSEVLSDRLATLLDAMNYGESLELLTVELSILNEEETPGRLLQVLSGIHCPGKVIIRAREKSSQVLGKKDLERVVRYIGGELVLGEVFN